jgi:aldehyde:ferredoxin oxidoreductase
LWPPNPLPTREAREEFVKDWVGVPNEKFKQYYVDSDPRSHPTMEAACDTVDWMEMMHYIDDSTGLCNGFDSRVRRTPLDIHNLPHFISLATGIAFDEAKLWRAARRNRTLVRAINVSRGMRRKDETIPEDRYKHRDPETEAKLLDEYYKVKGFNNDGIPTKETLDELGLDYVREDLEKRGIL